jgi:hypothetical protein
MIYDSLDIIPYKLFMKIAETGDVTLLSDVETDISILNDIWTKLHDEHLNKNQTSESKKIFKLSKSIDELLTLNKVVLMACSSLRFEFNQELYDMIIGFGYQLSIIDTESYYSDIEKIERESNAYIIKAEFYKQMLPEHNENENVKSEYGIDDVMASYSLILGFDFDYNLVTYTKYHALQNQVNTKIKSIQKQNTKSDGKS